MDVGELYEDVQDVWEDDGKETEAIQLGAADESTQAWRRDVLGWLPESHR